ncbi:MAG TPA: Hpt domain-containing protein, partial [Planctomycetaceae bacterium]|nr:Hpt domain-containing protein [Planctomycetaceae bacterium]
SPTPAPSPQHEDATDALIDWAAAMKTVGGDRELLVELAETFLQACPGFLNDIQQAIQTGDAPLLQRAAHLLKGTFRTLGVTHPADIAEQLELLGKSNDLEHATDLLASLKTATDSVKTLLNDFIQENATAQSR